MANPIVPRNDANPVGTSRILGSARADLKKRMKRVGQRTKILFSKVPVEEATPDDAGIATNANSVYRYFISPYVLNNLSLELQQIIEQEMGDGDVLDPFLVSSFNLGTSAAITNLVAQAPEYPVTAERAILSPQHQVRVNIVKSRVFEEMSGLNVEMRAGLNRILSEGMQNGQNPRLIARQIYEQVGLPEWNSGKNKASYARSLKIARTEINMAHRQATQYQDQDANKMGVKTGLLWFSALSRTTRRNHARRNGNVYTREQVNDFYSRDANAINCKCSQTSVVLNEDGTPRSENLIKKVKASGKKYFDSVE